MIVLRWIALVLIAFALIVWFLGPAVETGPAVTSSVVPVEATPENERLDRVVTAPIHVTPGRLVLQFNDADKGVPGVEVEIAGEDGPLAARSDEGGTVIRELPDGTYRWRLLSDLAFPVVPADEKAEFLRGWRDESATFEIRRNETQSFVMELGNARVLGSVHDLTGALVDGYRIRLMSQHIEETRGGLDFNEGWHDDVDDTFTGAFALERIRASQKVNLLGEDHLTEKMLWVTWARGTDVFMARRMFTLAAGEVKDLGAITFAGSGSALEVDVVFRDLNGDSVDPFVAEVAPHLQITTSDYVPMIDEVAEGLHVRPGITTFHNIPRGRYDLEVDEPLVGWPELKEGHVFIEDGAYVEDVQVPGGVTLPLIVGVGAVDVRVVIPPLQHLEKRITVWAEREGGPSHTKRARWIDDQFVVDLRLLPGHWTISASNNYLMNPPDHPSRWAETSRTIRKEDAGEILLRLAESARITGTAIDVRLRKAHEGLLIFEDWRGRRFKVRSDAAGKFSLGGIPPAGTLISFGDNFRIGATDVQVRKRPMSTR